MYSWQVAKIVPKDPDAMKKLRECEKAVQKMRFEEAIASNEHDRISVAEKLDYHSIGISSLCREIPLCVHPVDEE